MKRETFIVAIFILSAAGCAHVPAQSRGDATDVKRPSDALEEDEILRTFEPHEESRKGAPAVPPRSSDVPPPAGAASEVSASPDRKEEREDSLLSALEPQKQHQGKADMLSSGVDARKSDASPAMNTIREDPLLSVVDPEEGDPLSDLEENGEEPVTDGEGENEGEGEGEGEGENEGEGEGDVLVRPHLPR